MAFALLWALFAAANLTIVWQNWRKRASASMIPFVGGVCALIAFATWSGPIKLRAALLGVALLLDIGSMPSMALLFLVSITAEGVLERLYRKAASVTWGVRLGIGFLLWMLLAGGVTTIAEQVGIDSNVVFGSVTIVFWLAYTVFLLGVWRYRRAHPPI